MLGLIKGCTGPPLSTHNGLQCRFCLTFRARNWRALPEFTRYLLHMIRFFFQSTHSDYKLSKQLKRKGIYERSLGVYKNRIRTCLVFEKSFLKGNIMLQREMDIKRINGWFAWYPFLVSEIVCATKKIFGSSAQV